MTIVTNGVDTPFVWQGQPSSEPALQPVCVQTHLERVMSPETEKMILDALAALYAEETPVKVEYPTRSSLVTPPWFRALPLPEQLQLFDLRDPAALDHFGGVQRSGAMYCRCGQWCRPGPTQGVVRCPRCGVVILEIVASL